MKPSGIGGMAVIEGVMMKNKEEYAIAVRKPNNEIAIEKKSHRDFSNKVKLFKLPIFRGMLAFVDSMVLGLSALNFSAAFFEEEEAQEESKENNDRKDDKKSDKVKQDKANEDAGQEKTKTTENDNALLMALAVIISLVVSITLFMVVPVFLSNLLSRWISSVFLLALAEGIIRLLIFIGYIVFVSQMKDIKRVFMYHGAEHKTINCIENGFELTLENVKWQSKAHKRCGTSFMLLVMLISLVLFVLIRPRTLALRVLSRILLVPIVAGISYEFIRFAGRSESRIVDIISRPGLWMQALTTREPDDDMLEVAMASVEAVFDWREFLNRQESEKAAKQKTKEQKPVKQKPVKKMSARQKTVAAKQNAKELNEKVREIKYRNNDSKSEYAAVREISIASPKQDDNDEDDEILKALDKYLDLSDDD